MDKHNVWSRRSLYSRSTPTLISIKPHETIPRPVYYVYKSQSYRSSINPVKWPRIREARIPDFINHLCRLHVILAARSVHDRFNCPHSHAILVLLCYRPVTPRKEFSRPPAFSAQTRSSNLNLGVSKDLFPLFQGRRYTSVQAACLRSAQSTFHLKWSQACTIS